QGKHCAGAKVLRQAHAAHAAGCESASCGLIPTRGLADSAGIPNSAMKSWHSQGKQQWAEMGYLLGQKRRKVGRLQRQAARCLLVMQEASSVELHTWCWPRAVLIEKRPLIESERSSMNRAVRSIGARRTSVLAATIGSGECRMTWRRAGTDALQNFWAWI